MCREKMEQYRAQIAQLVQRNPNQLSVDEYLYIINVINSRTPGNFLIFGVGRDSSLWMEVNGNGRTVFLEDNPGWLTRMKSANAGIEAYRIEYNTQRWQWRQLLAEYRRGIDRLSMELPECVAGTPWDFIFVDAPAGYKREHPGRMKSICAAAKLAGNNNVTDVFVHDCNRKVERVYCDYFLQKEHLVTAIGRMRHYYLAA